MPEHLRLTPTESVELCGSTTKEALEVRVTYLTSDSPPPSHLHPAQDEWFEVEAGSLRVEVGGERRDLAAGDALEIPRGTTHRMWNPGEEAAVARWRTSPAGRTEEWFRALDRLQRDGRVGRGGMPGPLALGVLLSEYRDVFRPAGPDPLLRPLLAALGVLGRARGYAPSQRVAVQSAPAKQ